MTKHVELVKRMVQLCESRDFEALKPLIDKNYTLKDPMTSLQGPDALIEFLENCPADGHFKNAEYLEAGDKVIMTGDCVMTKPTPFSFRMCDIVTVRDGKVLSEETFYDTANFPEEALQAGQQRGGGKKKAA